MSAYLYILHCADGSYYIGTTRDSLERRLAEHQVGAFDGYTARRRPVSLVFHQSFESVEDAISVERQIKGWRREKKEPLIHGDYRALPLLAGRGRRVEDAGTVSASFETRPSGAPQDEERLRSKGK